MVRHGRVLGLSITLMGAVSAPSSDAKIAQAGGSEVSFTAVGPAGMKIVGTGNDVHVADDGKLVTVAVRLAGVKTGIGLRDQHMHDKYLQTPKFPTAELEVPRSALRLPGAGENVALDTTGTLRLHGKSKVVSFHYTCSRGSSMKVAGTVRLNMQDFGIEVPSYLGVSVRPDVDVSIRFEANDT
jgi:polyisoprenoid-binding protein YceI